MADKKDNEKKEETSEKTAQVKGYEKVIDRLQQERKALENEVTKDYREARHYVRAHPEEGVLIGFIGGIALGFLLGKLSK